VSPVQGAHSDALPSSPAPIDSPTAEWHKSCASEAPNPGRHHVGTPGEIISECLGDFIGNRMQRKHGPIRPCKYKSALRGGRRFRRLSKGYAMGRGTDYYTNAASARLAIWS